MPPAKKVAVACQGGGSHAAFTAGVLKVLLRQADEHRYRLMALVVRQAAPFHHCWPGMAC
jgi:NTE family protein